jgi:hypothetical protein
MSQDEYQEETWLSRQVLNGCSDLFVEVLADKGVHARSVVGANSLRGGVQLVLKAIVKVTQS